MRVGARARARGEQWSARARRRPRSSAGCGRPRGAGRTAAAVSAAVKCVARDARRRPRLRPAGRLTHLRVRAQPLRPTPCTVRAGGRPACSGWGEPRVSGGLRSMAPICVEQSGVSAHATATFCACVLPPSYCALTPFDVSVGFWVFGFPVTAHPA